MKFFICIDFLKKRVSLQVFYSSASLQIAEIAENFKKMEEAYRDVCLIMGENYKMIEPTCFFGILADFFQKFKVSIVISFCQFHDSLLLQNFLSSTGGYTLQM